MLLSKSINKIFRTTLIVFLILTAFTLISFNKEKVFQVNMEMTTVEEIPKTEIYLLSNDEYLVEANIYLENKTIEEKVKKIIEFLKEGNNKIPKGLNGYLINNIKVNKIIYEDNNLKLDFSKEFLNIDNIDLAITGVVYSLLKIPDIETVEIFVENNYLENYNYKLNSSIGINKKYLLKDRNDIKKVTVYYYNEIDNVEYLTPVTKYVNDEREKVEIIIEELSNNVPDNLIGYLSEKTKLINYKVDNELILLNFDKGFKSLNSEINNKIMNLIAESIFENLDIKTVFFQENSEKIEYIKKN